MTNIIYAFLYNPSVHESTHATMSVHYTREGAEREMEAHKEKMQKQFNELFPDGDPRKEFVSFGQYEEWAVEEWTIQD